MNNFCTYFDSNYLSRGLALYQSMKVHFQFTLYVLCMDKVTYELLENMNLDNMILLHLKDLELAYPDLLDVKESRSIIEYYFTCSPILPLYILRTNKDLKRITYIDADIYFFSNVKKLFEEIAAFSIAIVEHRYRLLKKRNLRYGKFNVGLISFKNDTMGLSCLESWKVQCIDWCYDRIEDNKYADQKYLDSWPDKFSNIIIIRNNGVNLAPWSVNNNYLTFDGSTIKYKNDVLVFYHFHGLKKLNQSCWESSLHYHLIKCSGVIKEQIYIPYLKKLSDIELDLEKNYLVEISSVQPRLINHSSNLLYGKHFIYKLLSKLLWSRICLHKN